MKVSELIAFYKAKNRLELSKKIGVVRSTISGWEKNGIPPKTQALLELKTKGKVKADLSNANAA